MTANQEALTFALKMYGEAMIKDAASFNKDNGFNSDTYEQMMFWHNQAWMLAKEIAQGKQG